MQLLHGRVRLELRRLREGEGLPLLLLHALHGAATDWGEGPAWPGPVHALDFSGHGDSGWVKGGVYYPELFSADADVALAELGSAAVVGAGLGAYVALLLAGARPEQVPGAVLLPGAGLEGAGPEPDFGRVHAGLGTERVGEGTPHDPYVGGCDDTVRPVDYAEDFARAASRLLLVEDGEARPPWWQAAARAAAAAESVPDLASALARIAGRLG